MKYILVVKVPETYSFSDRKELQKNVELAVSENRPVVIPNDMEIFSLPIDDG